MAKKPKKKKNPVLGSLLRGLSRQRGQIKPISAGKAVARAPIRRPTSTADLNPKPKPKPKAKSAPSAVKPTAFSAPASAAMLKSVKTMRLPKVTLASKVLTHNVKLHHAALAKQLSNIAIAQIKVAPKKKGDIDGPVSSVPEPAGTTIFENGKDPSRKYVLPEYFVAEDDLTDASGTLRKEVVATAIASDGRFMLEVGLDPHRSQRHKTHAADAEFLDHSLRCTLEFPDPRLANSLASETAEELLEETGGRMIARFYFDSSAAFGEAMRAILETGKANLKIDRIAEVWLPVENKAKGTQDPKPNNPRRRARAVGGTVRERRRPRRVRAMPVAQPQVAVQMLKLDPQQIRAFAELQAKAQAAQTYRKTSRTITQRLAFRLFRDLHENLLDAVGGEVPDGGAFRIERVEFDGRMHSYFVDPADRERVYFLPDSFRLQRKNDVPRTPLLLVRSVPSSEEGGEEEFELEFFATPHIDEDRLLAASKKLGFTDAGGKHHAFEFSPLSVSGAELRLALPGSSGGGFEVIANAQVDLQSGVAVRLKVTKTDFLSIYASLQGAGSHLLMTGEVKLNLGGPAPETIPVELRLGTMNGEVLELDRLEKHTARQLNISLLNVIESPVKIAGLEPVAVVGEATVPLTMVQTEPVFGTAIEPGSDFRFRVEAGEDLPDEGAFHVLFDRLDVAVEPDHEAILAAVHDQASSVALEQTIDVATFAPFFTMSGDHEKGGLIAFFVEFEDGDDVTLEATELKSQTSIELPLADLVFRKESEGEYSYRVSEIRERGMVGPTDWKSSTSSTLNILPLQPGDLA